MRELIKELVFLTDVDNSEKLREVEDIATSGHLIPNSVMK